MDPGISMSLRLKSVTVVVFAITLLIATLYAGARGVILGGFADAEAREMTHTVEATQRILTQMASEFSERGNDWADWDDMAVFLADGNEEFRESNIDASSFTQIGWDLFVIRTAEGKDQVAGLVNREKSELAPLSAAWAGPLAKLMAGAKDNAAPIYGFAEVDGKAYLLSSRPVRMTDKSPGATLGRFITGRWIDAAWMERIQKVTSLKLTFTSVAAARSGESAGLLASLGAGDHPEVRTPNETKLRGYGLINDLNGKPVLMMQIERDRAIYTKGNEIVSIAVRALGVAGILLALGTMFLMGRGVIGPLQRLLAGVRRLQGGERTQVPVMSRDEIGTLTGAFNEMSQTIASREDALREAHAKTKIILDSMGDGLITSGLDGQVDPDASRIACEWFGVPAKGVQLWDYLFGAEHKLGVMLKMGFEQIADDFLPFELLVEQLPIRFARAGREYELGYRRIGEAEGPVGQLLVIVRDVSERVAAEKAQREARELQLVVTNIVRDASDFRRCLLECESLLDSLLAAPSMEILKRNLHTLKGSAAILGFGSFSEVCHHIEDEIAEDASAFGASHVAALWDNWKASIDRVAAFLPQDRAAKISLSAGEYDDFVRLLSSQADHARLMRTAQRWALDPVAPVLERFGKVAERVAKQCGKAVRCEIDDGDVRSEGEQLAPFWNAFVHVVRNAVDHGIEGPEVRRSAGKPEEGTITFSTAVHDGNLVIEIRDDGAGIAWDKLRAKGDALGLPTKTEADLIELLFHDGVSSRDVVTELSGRGVGLSAVRETCLDLGGRIEVETTQGEGTALRFSFPVSNPSVQPGRGSRLAVAPTLAPHAMA